jgi:hypothetical protein
MTRSTYQPFPLLDQVPLALREVILDFQWDRQRLWALELPVVEVAMAELEWQLRLPWWALDGRPFVLTPDQVAQDPATYGQQYTRTQAADLRSPLHVLQRSQKLTVLDGVHRLLKAHLLGRDTVKVKKVLPGMLDDIAHR